MKIGIIAPSFRSEFFYIKRGLDLIKQHTNLKLELGSEVLNSPPRFTSPFTRMSYRLEELTTMLRDDSIDALWAVDGGAGAYRLLPSLDVFMSENKSVLKPKPIIGFSDITFLHMLFIKHNWPAWIAPNIWCETQDDEENLAYNLPYIERMLEGSLSGCIEEDGIDVLREGYVEGRLLGGTYSCLVNISGTPYCPDLKNSILITEEHGPDTPGQHEYLFWERFQRIELSGDWDGVEGIAFGDIQRCGPYPDDGEVFPNIWETIMETIGKVVKRPKPICTGIPFGLGNIPRPIPLGVQARLDVRDGRCFLEW